MYCVRRELIDINNLLIYSPRVKSLNFRLIDNITSKQFSRYRGKTRC